MSHQSQRLQQVASLLKTKISQFDAAKERSKKQISDDVKALKDLINTVEADLLRKTDRVFGNNPFASALAEITDNSSSSFIDYGKLERTSKEPVPSVTCPSEEDFFEAKKAILKLSYFDRKANIAPLRIVGTAVTFDAIELSWVSVPGAVAYQVEGRKPNDSVSYKVYEGSSLKHSVAGLEPGAKYLFRLRSVFSDSSVSEWSKEIEAKTQEAPVPCNITANIISCNAANVSWSPVPERGISYKVCVVEATENSARSCVVSRGQNTWYRPSGLRPGIKYSFCVQAGRGNAWSKWSSTVTVGVPQSVTSVAQQNVVAASRSQNTPNLPNNTGRVVADAKRWNYAWKECSDYVNCERKYSVDKENPNVATFAGDNWCTIIGSTPLPQDKVTSWSIKILKSKYNGGGIFVGVAPFDINQNEDQNYNKCGWYLDCCHSTLCSGPPHDYNKKEYGPRKEDGHYIHTGDSVGVVMDTAKGELSFVLKDVSLGIAYEVIPRDKPLVPCVLLGNKYDSVEIVI